MDLELHIMEYDRTCGENWFTMQSNAMKQRLRMHFGDQSLVEDLARVMIECDATRMSDTFYVFFVFRTHYQRG